MRAIFVNEAFKKKTKEQGRRDLLWPEEMKYVLQPEDEYSWTQLVSTTESKKEFESDLITVWFDRGTSPAHYVYIRIGDNYYITLADNMEDEGEYLEFDALDGEYNEIILRIDKETGYPTISDHYDTLWDAAL